jgi:hypothetical protein
MPETCFLQTSFLLSSYYFPSLVIQETNTIQLIFHNLVRMWTLRDYFRSCFMEFGWEKLMHSILYWFLSNFTEYIVNRSRSFIYSLSRTNLLQWLWVTISLDNPFHHNQDLWLPDMFSIKSKMNEKPRYSIF